MVKILKTMFEKEELYKIQYAIDWYVRDGLASEEEFKEILHKLKTLDLKYKKEDLEKEIKLLQKEVLELSDN